MARHEQALATLLADRAAPVAWKVVTTYYSAFFAASELLRASGRVVLRLTSEHTEQIVARDGSGIPLEPGTYFGDLAADARTESVFANLVKTQQGDHEVVWNGLRELVDSVTVRNAEEREFQRFLTACLHGRSHWCSPSVVRNEWNYRRPELYETTRGQQLGRVFIELMTSPDTVYAWARTPRLRASEGNLAATVALWRAVLLECVQRVTPIFRLGR